MSGPRVVVVGAGVIGLTTAITLAEAGAEVLVIAADVPGTTSLAAGAIWGPYAVEPGDRVRRWSQHSLRILQELAADPRTGVRLVSGIEAARHPTEAPDWAPQLPDYRPCRPDELPDGFVTGHRHTVPLIDMPMHLNYLIRRFQTAGGRLEARTLGSLAELDGAAPVVVNCAGIGARSLAPDPELFPIRGQHLVVDNPGVTEFFVEDTGDSADLLGIYPHRDTVVLGGTALPGDHSLRPDHATDQAILERCQAIIPALANANILERRVGLRPTRPAIRLEQEPSRGTPLIIHNYGHGGAGVTLSWGCATEVTRLVTGGPAEGSA